MASSRLAGAGIVGLLGIAVSHPLFFLNGIGGREVPPNLRSGAWIKGSPESPLGPCASTWSQATGRISGWFGFRGQS